MLISPFLPPAGGQFWIKAVQFNSQTDDKDSLRQTILYDYNNQNNKKQAK